MNQSQDEQFQTLCREVKCKIAPSKIHGVGVFAIRDIKKGEKLYLIPNKIVKWYNLSYSSLKSLFRKVYPEILELILERWPSVINGSQFISPNDMAVMVTFVNHSDDPNYDVDNDMALKDIPKNTEILENYRLMENYRSIYKWLD